MNETAQNGSTALVSTQIQGAVERALGDVQQFIDSDQSKAKMQYVLVRMVAENTDLQRCTPASFAVAVYEMFKLGLDPRGQNEAWLIPRKNKAGVLQACFQTGYAGKRKLALNDPRVADVFAKAFHKNDTYELDLRTGAPLHTYSPFGDRGPIVGYFSAVRYRDGSWHTEEMDLQAMRKWRDTYSAAAKKSVWKEDRGEDGRDPCSFDGMALKVMLGQICHTRHMSLSPEAQEALATDDRLYGREKDVTPYDTGHTATPEEAAEHIKDINGDREASDRARAAATRPPVPDMVIPPKKDAMDPRELKAALIDKMRKLAGKADLPLNPVWAAIKPLWPKEFDLDKLTPEMSKAIWSMAHIAIEALKAEKATLDTAEFEAVDTTGTNITI